MTHVEGAKRILVVDDEQDMRTLLCTALATMDYRPAGVGTGEAAVEYLQRNPPPAVVLLDLNLPGMSGLETFRRILSVAPGQKVVMISCLGDADKIVAAVKLGASDYLVKPFPNAALQEALRRCLAENDSAAEPERASFGPLPFICQGPVMQLIRENANRVASADVPVLLLGESGVGKEVVARYLHFASDRASRKFIKVNCAALPADLLESELFGYERGAFTGANGSKPGKFELAHGGTLFLDEIGEMPPSLQAKLLHVLQDGRYFRLGATTPTQVRVRVIAATNINLKNAIAEGKFRQDLYYRLNVFSITIPPLRERRDEIPVFVDHFLTKHAPGRSVTISAPMLERVKRAAWPGNLRELENVIQRLVIFGDESMMLGEFEPEAVVDRQAMAVGAAVGMGASPSPSRAFNVASSGTLSGGAHSGDLRGLRRETERRAIQAALENTQWRRKDAARVLNISYKALLYKMRELQLS